MLDNIGFYTLTDERAKNSTWDSGLQRCELILTDRCNIKCPYCRGLSEDIRGDISIPNARKVIDLWADGNLKNIRFSGGEPTIWNGLLDLIRYTKTKKSMERIALSTNGSASINDYIKLFTAGVNDFSISLDACCSSTANKMAGVNARFDHTAKVIRVLSDITYVTVGVVLDNQNNKELQQIIQYATGLGVSDIRIIPSAQSNHYLKVNVNTEYPILKYRINNINSGRHVRGIKKSDTDKCHLVKDDMVVVKNNHYPCIIYMRERGGAIGNIIGKSIMEIRKERKTWAETFNTHKNKICSVNCLDVCIDYNNAVECNQRKGGIKNEMF